MRGCKLHRQAHCVLPVVHGLSSLLVVRGLLDEAGYSALTAHPLDMLHQAYVVLPSLDTLSNLLVADLKSIKDKVLAKCQDRQVFWRCIMRRRRELWCEALRPALQLVLVMRQWNIGGPSLDLVTPQGQTIEPHTLINIHTDSAEG